MIKTSFWCKECEVDFDKEATLKRVLGSEYFASACQRGHEVIRLITNKTEDPYFLRSKKLKKQRSDLTRDLIQPGQYGFETLYKKEYDKIEKAREAHEIQERKRVAEQEAYYKKLKEQQVSSKLIHRAMEAESEQS